MIDDTLSEPVARLLALGEPIYTRDFLWPDYLSLGISVEHVAALIEVATNHDLILLPDEKDPRGWAPIHAWRALGQLHASEAIEPLMRLFHEVRDNDWVIEEMPDVFALIGPYAFPPLENYLQDSSFPIYSRLVAATCLMQMALAHPQVREMAIQVLSSQLESYVKNTPGMNGVLIANLVELEAIEKVELIHQVFKDGLVDRFIVGDWREVKLRLQPGNDKRSLGRYKGIEKSAPTFPDPEKQNGNSAA